MKPMTINSFNKEKNFNSYYPSLNNNSFLYKDEVMNFKVEIRMLNNKIEKQNKEIKDFGLKFKTDNNENAFYDIIIDITSIKNLNNEGWIVKYPKKEKGRD